MPFFNERETVIFREHKRADGSLLGEIKLNSPETLNAVNLGMARSVKKRLNQWKNDKNIALIFFHGAGGRAFCAGGDVKALYFLILEARKEKTDPAEAVQPFFQAEYEMNNLLRAYPKPVVLWGEGIVMGGGMGTFQAVSHPIVTETSRLAMPEISIGLFPDVGAGWFLSRLPDKLGWYLALAGCRLSGAEVLALKWSRLYFENREKDKVFERLLSLPFKGKEDLTRRLQELKTDPPPFAGWIERFKEPICRLVRSGNVKTIYREFQNSSLKDERWVRNRETFLNGAPSSAGIICELLKRGERQSVREVCRMDLVLALQCARRPDFSEGVRALLVEKTGNPSWNPASIPLLKDSYIQESFTAPPGWTNPL